MAAVPSSSPASPRSSATSGRPRTVPPVDDVLAVGRRAGLDAVGIAPATAFATTRRHLERRRAAGRSDTMAFTYRRPEVSTDPGHALPDAAALVVGARAYSRTTPSAGPGGGGPAGSPGSTRPDRPQGRVARYAWEDHYGPLKRSLTAVAKRLKADGWRARVLADDNALVDREAAYRAGLGWYGKNANLLLPGEGSWFVLGAVVTDAPLAATGPAERVADGCGTCTQCVASCPTGAIVAPGVVDARRCLAWLLQVEGPFPAEFRVALGDRLYGCDDCQEVCPPNRRRWRDGPGPPPAGDAAEVTVDLLDLLAASDGELLDRHGRWYVPGRQARYLRRNALVALGNAADPASPAVVAALRSALAADDPLVRGHAVWAARRLGRADLLGGLADDPDPQVRAELAAEVAVRSGPRPGLDVRPPGRDHQRAGAAAVDRR
jgi:epoxyqueuosine reductase